MNVWDKKYKGKKTKIKGKKGYAAAKEAADKKFGKKTSLVYPSAYANAWLVREYKKRGGKY